MNLFCRVFFSQESYGMTSDLPDFRKHYTWRSYSAPFYFPFFNSYVEVNILVYLNLRPHIPCQIFHRNLMGYICCHYNPVTFL